MLLPSIPKHTALKSQKRPMISIYSAPKMIQLTFLLTFLVAKSMQNPETRIAKYSAG